MSEDRLLAETARCIDVYLISQAGTCSSQRSVCSLNASISIWVKGSNLELFPHIQEVSIVLSRQPIGRSSSLNSTVIRIQWQEEEACISGGIHGFSRCEASVFGEP